MENKPNTQGKPLTWIRQIGDRGQVVIPAKLREYLGRPAEIEFYMGSDNAVCIRAAPTTTAKPEMVKNG